MINFRSGKLVAQKSSIFRKIIIFSSQKGRKFPTVETFRKTSNARIKNTGSDRAQRTDPPKKRRQSKRQSKKRRYYRLTFYFQNSPKF